MGISNVPNILIVDDTLANLQVLSGMLKERGYKIRPVPSGKLALQAAKNEPPDLILLDINMPEMNGYEVCVLLKEQEKLKDIPVIFISALNETMDKVKAFAMGGVDYITKPFQFEEVESRVATHLELRRQRMLLKESLEKQKELEGLRDSLVHMIIHDMRTPLQGITGYLQLFMKSRENMDAKKLAYIEKAKSLSEILVEMVSSILDVNKMEAGEMNLKISPVELKSMILPVVERLDSLKANRKIILEIPDTPIYLLCDSELISRVIQNLLSNALKHTSEADGEIRIGIEKQGKNIRIFVHDNGNGIPAEYHEKIFQKFGRVEIASNKLKYSSGLGLAFCKMVVNAHGGTIGVQSDTGKGSTFWFILQETAS